MKIPTPTEAAKTAPQRHDAPTEAAYQRLKALIAEKLKGYKTGQTRRIALGSVPEALEMRLFTECEEQGWIPQLEHGGSPGTRGTRWTVLNLWDGNGPQ